MGRAGSTAAVVATLVMLMSGCATGTPLSNATEVTQPSPSGSPTPTCAAPAQPGVEPPEGCVVYDPEKAMEQNERHRERLDAPGSPAQDDQEPEGRSAPDQAWQFGHQ